MPNLLDEVLRDNPTDSESKAVHYADEDKILAPILDEINEIEDHGLSQFVRAILLRVPEFFTVASADPPLEDDDPAYSMPPDEHGKGGLVLHTKRVVRATLLFCESQERAQLERDLLVAAAILHDITRMIEDTEGTYFYDHYHMVTVDSLIEAFRAEDEERLDETDRSTTQFLDEDTIFTILRLIHVHMGPWGPIREVFPLNSMEWILHFADHVSSRIHYILDGPLLKESRWQHDQHQ